MIVFHKITSEVQEGDERITQNCKIPDSDIYLFEETGDIPLFIKKNYRVSISVFLMAHTMFSVNTVFNTSAWSDHIRGAFLGIKWLRNIQAGDRPALKKTINQMVSAAETITIDVRMCSSRVKIVFSVIYNLAVPVLLETSFTDSFLMIIVPPERKIIPYDSNLLRIPSIEKMPGKPKKWTMHKISLSEKKMPNAYFAWRGKQSVYQDQRGFF